MPAKKTRSFLKHPGAKARKKNTYWCSTYGKIDIIERCPTVDEHRVRPFSHSAQIHSREYTRIIQRKSIVFSADCSFRSAAKKMQEHYGIEVPESTIRAIIDMRQRIPQQV